MAASFFYTCPTNETTWTVRAATFSCQPLENYHCLINEFFKLIELCASPIWIESGNCPQYNSQADQLDSVACSSIFNLPCPSRTYRSNTVYNYQVCTTSPEKGTTASVDVVNQTQSPDQITGDCESLCRVLIAVALVVTLVVLTLLLWFLRKRGKICAKRKGSAEEVELLEKRRYSCTEEEKKIQARTSNLVESKKVAEMSKIIMTYGAISIIGTWGSGKTSLAEQIFMECKQSNTRRFKPLSSIDEWQSVVGEEGNGVSSFILFEDCIKEWYEAVHVKSLIQKISDLVSFCKANPQDCVLVITLQHNVWKRFDSIVYTCPIFNKKQTNPQLLFDISSDWNVFTKEEKSKLMEQHMEVNKITIGKLEDIILDKTKPAVLDDKDKKLLLTCKPKSVGLPGLISLLCKNRVMLHSVNEFIKDPINHVKKSLECLKKSKYEHERCAFAILVYVMFHDGTVCSDDIESELLNEIKSLYRVEETVDLKCLGDKHISDFLEIDVYETSLSIHHRFIIRILFILVARDNFTLLITKCNRKLLLSCIEPHGPFESVTSSNIIEDFSSKLVVRIPQRSYKELAELFLDLKTEQPDIIHHVMFNSNDFIKEWKLLQEKSECQTPH